MKIGNVELENNIFLAPMAGITDLPFRLICKEQGAGLVYTEMVSSKALFYGDEKTKQLLKSNPKEKPLAVQIFGSDLEAIKYSVKYLNDYADIIDINMGCPAPKIVKNGDGSKILLDLELVKQIVEVAVNNAKVPITVKIRKGWDNEHVVAVEAAKIIENAGASAIAVHGRTRNQFYAGEADWDIIKKVKESHFAIQAVDEVSVFNFCQLIRFHLLHIVAQGFLLALDTEGSHDYFVELFRVAY